jgi:heme oxygenase
VNTIKEETKELHEDLEALPFNQKMFRGEQTPIERISYLLGLQSIFMCLDQYVPAELRRYKSIVNDLAILHDKFKLNRNETAKFFPWTGIGYVTYLDSITDAIEPHVYLNYMGLMFGGQIMKRRYPQYPMSVYEFDGDLAQLKKYIREEVCLDTEEFIAETKIGFKWNMAMIDELGEDLNVE